MTGPTLLGRQHRHHEHIHSPRLAGFGLLLLLATIGCQNTAQPPVAPHSNAGSSERPRSQPRDSSDYAGNDQETREAGRAADARWSRPRLGNSISTCLTSPGPRSSALPTGAARSAGVTWALWCTDCGPRMPMATIHSIAACARPGRSPGRHRHHTHGEPGRARMADARHLLRIRGQ